jgi:hypothetical protein
MKATMLTVTGNPGKFIADQGLTWAERIAAVVEGPWGKDAKMFIQKALRRSGLGEREMRARMRQALSYFRGTMLEARQAMARDDSMWFGQLYTTMIVDDECDLSELWRRMIEKTSTHGRPGTMLMCLRCDHPRVLRRFGKAIWENSAGVWTWVAGRGWTLMVTAKVSRTPVKVELGPIPDTDQSFGWTDNAEEGAVELRLLPLQRLEFAVNERSKILVPAGVELDGKWTAQDVVTTTPGMHYVENWDDSGQAILLRPVF